MPALTILALLLLSTNSAFARVFDFSKETVAPYINIQGGLSGMDKDPYYWQTPASFTGSEPDYVYGGEFGVIFRSGGFGFFAGTKITTYSDLEEVKAFNGSSAEIYSVNSSAIAFAPLGGFLFQFGKSTESVFNFMVGAGYQWSKIENTYTMTATGTTDTGLTDFSETFKQQSLFIITAVGYEFHLSGASTMSIDVGYHYNFASHWSYGEGGTNLAGGYSQGGAVKLEDGTDKEVTWRYPYVQIGFRFYIETI